MPKTGAAALLGVSVVELAHQVELLREEGAERGVVAAAFERLAAEGKPKRRPRPNMSARELRADYLSSTPLERLAVGVELSRTAAILAAYGRPRIRTQK